MAEHTSAKTIENAVTAPCPVRAFTGGTDEATQLYPQLRRDLQSACSVDIVVSFLMESGVRHILDELRSVVSRGVPIRILTSDYLGITHPTALYMLRGEFRNDIDLRMFPAQGQPFHPKAYILHWKDGSTAVYVGSSNLSRGALTTSIEWNYRLSSVLDRDSTDRFEAAFEDLFANHARVVDDDLLERYAADWRRPPFAHMLPDAGAQDMPTEAVQAVQPHGVQIEALYALDRSRAEGADRGLVHAATGIGKTFIAAFDSLPFRRVLFVAHREEILRQAADAFAAVRPTDTRGQFTGAEKDLDADIVFASVATLGKKTYLRDAYFAPDAFDYIVVDEFHHAASAQYRHILDYFRPKFLLGLTATPERLDGRSIYELCDYNVPYEISLQQAINRGLLAPFRYYGVYDPTDYDSVRRVNGHYDQEALTATYAASDLRTELILGHYRKHAPRSALGFCCSREHAETMARAFCEAGIPAAAVYSGEQGQYAVSRSKAISRLTSGGVVFSVDMFNEGVDVPSVDMVMFLRPTESPVVFLQQLGRGLRKSPGKDALIVLDFIGNYARADQIPQLLGETDTQHSTAGSAMQMRYPDGCTVDFDLRLIDLFRRMEERTQTLTERVRAQFTRIKDMLGWRPSRVEFFTHMDGDLYEACWKTGSSNPFRDYLGFLSSLGELTPDEQALADSIGHDFIRMLETTQMTRVYKMPVLQSLIADGELRTGATTQDVLDAWKAFFGTAGRWRDLPNVPSAEAFDAISDKEHLRRIRTMPIKYLLKSSDGLLEAREGYMLSLSSVVADLMPNPALAAHMTDIIEYRTLDYFRRRYMDRKAHVASEAE